MSEYSDKWDVPISMMYYEELKSKSIDKPLGMYDYIEFFLKS